MSAANGIDALAGTAAGRVQGAADAVRPESVRVPLDSLGPGPKVRRENIDLDHVNALVETDASWPPILVCKADWGRPYRVIDGNHRVAAAGRLGRSALWAHVLDVDVKSAEAVEAAVKANVEHGRPLSLAERKSQAKWFIDNTDWADSRIGLASGLSNKTVAALRPKAPRATSEIPKLRGADGKARPASDLAAAEARQMAAAEIAEKPTASDREVAQRTGLSPRTVADVRRRTAVGEDPSPPRLRAVPDPEPEKPAEPEVPKVSVGDVLPSVPNDWRHHPAANRTNDTRQFMRFMNRWGRWSKFTDETEAHIRHCPPDAVDEVVRNARWMAESWSKFADRLANRPTVEET